MQSQPQDAPGMRALAERMKEELSWAIELDAIIRSGHATERIASQT